MAPRNAEHHAPAGAAAAQAHHQARPALRAAVAGGQDAERPVKAVHARKRMLSVGEAGRPHQRAVAEHPEVAFRHLREDLAERHDASFNARRTSAADASRPPADSMRRRARRTYSTLKEAS